MQFSNIFPPFFVNTRGINWNNTTYGVRSSQFRFLTFEAEWMRVNASGKCTFERLNRKFSPPLTACVGKYTARNRNILLKHRKLQIFVWIRRCGCAKRRRLTEPNVWLSTYCVRELSVFALLVQIYGERGSRDLSRFRHREAQLARMQNRYVHFLIVSFGLDFGFGLLALDFAAAALLF